MRLSETLPAPIRLLNLFWRVKGCLKNRNKRIHLFRAEACCYTKVSAFLFWSCCQSGMRKKSADIFYSGTCFRMFQFVVYNFLSFVFVLGTGREYANPFPATLAVYKHVMVTENGNRSYIHPAKFKAVSQKSYYCHFF